MENPIAKSVGGLIDQSTNAIAGLQAYEVQLNLTTVTAGTFTPVLTAFTAGQNTCNSARTELSGRKRLLRSKRSEARKYLGLARDILKPHLGQSHSTEWIQAGFLQSLALPRRVDKLLPMLSALAAYFAEHEGHQNEALNVTGARATTFFNELTAASSAVNTQKTTMAAAKTARDEKGAEISKILRGLLKELGLRMGPMDDRYLTFGFNLPGQLVTPEMPGNLAAILIGPTAVSVKWTKAARAAHYRVWKRVVGVDTELVPAGKSSDLDLTLEGLPANSTIEIAVSAVNNGGESAQTKVVVVQTM